MARQGHSNDARTLNALVLEAPKAAPKTTGWRTDKDVGSTVQAVGKDGVSTVQTVDVDKDAGAVDKDGASTVQTVDVDRDDNDGKDDDDDGDDIWAQIEAEQCEKRKKLEARIDPKFLASFDKFDMMTGHQWSFLR